jgi:hypothetical protein
VTVHIIKKNREQSIRTESKRLYDSVLTVNKQKSMVGGESQILSQRLELSFESACYNVNAVMSRRKYIHIYIYIIYIKHIYIY